MDGWIPLFKPLSLCSGKESKSPSVPARFSADFCAQRCRTDLFLHSGGLIRWLLFAAGDRQTEAVDATGASCCRIPQIFWGFNRTPNAQRHCELLPLPNFPRNCASLLGLCFCLLASFSGRVAAGGVFAFRLLFCFLFLGN